MLGKPLQYKCLAIVSAQVSTKPMTPKEAQARIKINQLLEAAGWRFFVEGGSPANIQLEPRVTIKTQDLDAPGENFELPSKRSIDFLLLNDRNVPAKPRLKKAKNFQNWTGQVQLINRGIGRVHIMPARLKPRTDGHTQH